MASPFALTVFSLFTLLPILAASSSRGFSVELIHRDSPKSPLFDPNSTPTSRLREAADRSRSRAIYFRDAIRRATLSPSDTTFYSEIIPNTYEYLMSFYLGTPYNQILATADTGSDLIWVQCVPCNECYQQSTPLFDPQASSTYKTISCNTGTCSALPQSGCGSSSQCQYEYGYGDGSLVEGFLSTETISFDSTGGRPVKFPTTIFGCTHKSNGTFDKKDAGLVGLGGGKLSLIRQLGSTIGSKFSYCLPLSSDTSAKSRLNFGSNAIVSGSNQITTQLISGSPDTFYFLNLEQINVAGKPVIVGKPKQAKPSNQGNIIIDSGTTLTLIDSDTLQSVEKNVKKSLSLPQVTDPNNVFSLCFDVSGSGTSAKFPEITFQFSGGASVVLQQPNAFIEAADNVVCLAMVSSGTIGEGINIFGNIAQQNFHIGYDLDAMKLTFVPTNCATL